MGKRLFALLSALFLLAAAAACAEICSVSQLNAPGMTVGVDQGSAAELTARRELPLAQIAVFNDKPSAYLAVSQGKIDAFVFDSSQMRLAIESGVEGVHILDETLGEPIRVAVGISPVSGIPQLESRLNRFIAEIRGDGTLDDMLRRWVDEGAGEMPDIPPPKDPALRLTVGTSGIVPPYSYYTGTELNGFDIEMGRRFAAWLGADLQFKVYDYGAIIPAAVTGEVDCVMANLNITPERAEALSFSDVLYEERVGVMVRGEPRPGQGQDTAVPSLDQLNGKRIGTGTGTVFDEIVKRRLPDVSFRYFSTFSDIIAALESGKIDAFVCDEPVLRTIMAENSQVGMIPEYLDTFEFGFIFCKDEAGAERCEQMSEFIREMRNSGELSRLEDKWLGSGMDEAKMPDLDALSGENGMLTMAVEALNPPFVFVQNNGYAGYEIELAARFCERYGYGLTIRNMDFDAILISVQTGKADFGGTTIAVTEERRETLYFSEPHYSGGTVMAVLINDGAKAAPEVRGAYSSVSELDGRTIGVQTGTSFDAMVAENLPDARVEYYNTKADLVAALTGNKVDAFVVDEPVAQILMREDDRITYLREYLDSFDFALVFPKSEAGEALREQFNAFLERLPEGALDELAVKWFGDDEGGKTMPDIDALPAENGTLRMATESGYAPFEYVRDGEVVGYDMELAALFCEAYGYGLEIVDMNFDGILPAVQAGKCDFAAAGIGITPERAESVLFSEPNFSGGTVLAVLKAEDTASATDSGGSGDDPGRGGIRSSFIRTFLREDRWRLFLQGVMTTLLITVSSILSGTALGFIVFMLCRNGNPLANLVTRFCLWLVQGMPMVVLLMILYYVIFGSVAINGAAVAVIGFTLTFGAAVYGLLGMGVGAVDSGQYEAACALGYSDRRTFYRIILPQALPHVLPAYRGEIVGLIKATAIVGYIAVQDLTKMGDIVRSRTYEAFFPLIAVTVIYFILEGLIGFLVGRISVNFNPKRRRPADILKGVRTDDQD